MERRMFKRKRVADANQGPTYYVYVSDTKVEMLLAQIPKRLRRQLSTQVKVNFKVVSLSAAEVPSPESRYSKLAIVREYFERNAMVTSVDEPGVYFGGQLEMRWAQLEDEDIVYFGGRTESSVLGLGGSLAHLVGAAKRSPEYGFSSYPVLREAIISGERQTTPYVLGGAGNVVRATAGSDEELAEAIVRTSRQPPGPVERLDFVARKLFESDALGIRVVLGTPIYVAYADGR